MLPRPLSFALLALLASACSGAPATPAPPGTPISLEAAGIMPALMDPSADACRDFYQLACGGFLKTVEIPKEYASWSPGHELQLRTEEFLRATLEKAAKEPGSDPGTKKLGAWYSACMNEDGIEKAGAKPLAPLLDIVTQVKDTEGLYRAVAELHKRTVFALWGISSQQDFKDATLVIAGLDQGGIGLPDRDYYLLEDADTKEIRAFYRAHVARMLGLLGDAKEDANKAADDVMRIETAIAKLSQDKVIRRDPYKIYNKVDRPGLAKAAAGFPWDAYFTALGFPAIKDVNVNSVDYFTGIDALMKSEKPEAWRSYLRWFVARAEASRLGKGFVDEAFSLKKKLTGAEEVPPRWKRCVRSADDALGELLAQEYVKAKFDAESKHLAEELVKAIGESMRAELGALPWMDTGTRATAEEKRKRMNNKIGYPERWRTYDFEVTADDYAKNAIAADTFDLARTLRKVGKPVDRLEWQMTPPTVNAYYDPSLNEMVFPAGILQPPYFSKAFTPAVNFGATGAVMGHELTHGFDDEGSQFDGAGNLRNWWSDATGKLFKQQVKCVADQYSTYEAVPGVHLNGELTAGENIADIGGLKLAYSAHREAQKRRSSRVSAGGYSEDQLFFIAFGQSWCEKMRPEALTLLAKTNPHSPPRFRVNGVVADVPAFAEAFSCKAGAPMAPVKPCSVW